MAHRHLLLIVAGLALLAGCQQQPQTSIVTNLPAPNFSGPAIPDPVVAPPPQPAPPPVVVAPTPKAPPREYVRGDIPASWIPQARPNQWYWIVIHHSATPTGGAAAFNREHKAKGWDELGYHFVIGNGTDTRDGQIEVGPRWPKQKWGAHAKTPDNRYNDHGIGICLVGNFDVSHPSEAQMRSLARLVSYLMRTYHIAPDHVLGHRDTKSTDCPGRYVNLANIRRMSAQMLADAGEPVPAKTHIASASGELLHDDRLR